MEEHGRKRWKEKGWKERKEVDVYIYMYIYIYIYIYIMLYVGMSTHTHIHTSFLPSYSLPFFFSSSLP